MKKNYVVCLLALSFTTLTACGVYPEAETESSTAADTIYVMTSAPPSPTAESISTAQTTAQSEKQTTAADTAANTDTAGTGLSMGNMTGENLPVTTAAVTAAHSETHGKNPSVPSTSEAVSSGKTGQVHTTARPSGSPSAPVHTNAPADHVSAESTALHSTQTTFTTHTSNTAHTDSASASSVTEVSASENETQTETKTEAVTSKVINSILVTGIGTDEPRAIEPFSNNHKVSTRYAQTLNHYKESLGNSVNVWNMVVPTSQAFYTPEEYADGYGDQQEEYQNITQHLSGVTSIPLFDTLSAHKDAPIYSRTDYHWQPLGAYYAAEQFAAFAGVPYAPLDTYEKVTREGYVGAFSKVNDVTLLEDYPEEFSYYKPANLNLINCTYYNTAFSSPRQGDLFHEDNGISSSYTVFVGTDECILEMETNVDNSRVLVIFKDSYGNALLPFLTQSFSKIYLCDFRYFDGNALNFIEEVGATDVLFAMSTMAVTTDSKVDLIADDLNLPEQ